MCLFVNMYWQKGNKGRILQQQRRRHGEGRRPFASVHLLSPRPRTCNGPLPLPCRLPWPCPYPTFWPCPPPFPPLLPHPLSSPRPPTASASTLARSTDVPLVSASLTLRSAVRQTRLVVLVKAPLKFMAQRSWQSCIIGLDSDHLPF